jgi:hypothetical protein
LSPRQFFADFISEDFEIQNYQQVDEKSEIKNYDKIVIQLESLLFANDSYDLIVLDEVESILNQFSSDTMCSKYLQIFKKLETLILNSTKVVCADAFILNRSLNFIRTICEKTESITMLHNHKPPEKRIAYQVESDEFDNVLMEEIQKNRKVFGCFSSKSQLIEFKMKLIAEYGDDYVNDLKNFLIYYSRCGNKITDTMKSMNLNWKNVKHAILTSPSITVGNSFVNTQPDEMVDRIFMKMMPSCTVRDMFQTHRRVRHVSDNVLIYSFKNMFNNNPKNCERLFEEYASNNLKGNKISIIKKFLENKIESAEKCKSNCDNQSSSLSLRKTKALFDNFEKTPKSLRDVLKFNFYEQTLSDNHYCEMLDCFLEKCGYTCKVLFGPVNKNKKNETCETDFTNMYEKIPIIKECDIDNLLWLEKKKKASLEQLNSIDKFFFEKSISDEALDIANIEINKSLCGEKYDKLKSKAKLFYTMWFDRTKRNIFENSKKEKSISNAYAESDFFRSDKIVEALRMNSPQIDMIKKLNNLLGLNNSFQKDVVIDVELIKSINNWLTTNFKYIVNIFSLNNVTQEDNMNLLKSQLSLIKQVYSNWSGLTFHINSKNKHKKTATSYITSSNYEFNYFELSVIYDKRYKMQKRKYDESEWCNDEDEDPVPINIHEDILGTKMDDNGTIDMISCMVCDIVSTILSDIKNKQTYRYFLNNFDNIDKTSLLPYNILENRQSIYIEKNKFNNGYDIMDMDENVVDWDTIVGRIELNNLEYALECV